MRNRLYHAASLTLQSLSWEDMRERCSIPIFSAGIGTTTGLVSSAIMGVYGLIAPSVAAIDTSGVGLIAASAAATVSSGIMLAARAVHDKMNYEEAVDNNPQQQANPQAAHAHVIQPAVTTNTPATALQTFRNNLYRAPLELVASVSSTLAGTALSTVVFHAVSPLVTNALISSGGEAMGSQVLGWCVGGIAGICAGGPVQAAVAVTTNNLDRVAIALRTDLRLREREQQQVQERRNDITEQVTLARKAIAVKLEIEKKGINEPKIHQLIMEYATDPVLLNESSIHAIARVHRNYTVSQADLEESKRQLSQHRQSKRQIHNPLKEPLLADNQSDSHSISIPPSPQREWRTTTKNTPSPLELR